MKSQPVPAWIVVFAAVLGPLPVVLIVLLVDIAAFGLSLRASFTQAAPSAATAP